MRGIREYLSQSEARLGTSVGFPLAIEPDFELGYTLEDLYRAFGNKKSLTRRLHTALQKRNIKTLEDFLSLTPCEMLELENDVHETLLRTKKALSKLGLSW